MGRDNDIKSLSKKLNIDQLFSEFDKDKSNNLDYNEFKALVNKIHPK